MKKENFFRDVRKFGNMKIITSDQLNEKFKPTYDLLNQKYNLQKHLNYLKTKLIATNLFVQS